MIPKSGTRHPHERMILTGSGGALLNREQWITTSVRSSQLVIINIGNDLRLLRDHGVERARPAAVSGFQNCVTADPRTAVTAVTCCTDVRLNHLRMASVERSPPICRC